MSLSSFARTRLGLGSLALLAVGLAACAATRQEREPARAGSSSAADPEAIEPGDPYEARLDFAECMRSRGIDYPDPEPDGSFRFDDEGGIVDSASAEEAERACSDHFAGVTDELDPEAWAALQDYALSYAECMRGQGIDFPDPPPSRDPGAIPVEPESKEDPAFQRANATCTDKLPPVEQLTGKGLTP